MRRASLITLLCVACVVLPSSGADAAAGPSWAPFKGRVTVGCTWNNSSPTYNCSGHHPANKPAIDLGMPIGTPIFASGDGTATKFCTTNDKNADTGLWITVRHATRTSRYLHLSKCVVGSGTYVRRGTLLGYSGNTGVSSGFAHLHYDEVRNDTSTRVNPGPMLLCRQKVRRSFPSNGDWSTVPAFERRIYHDAYNC